MIVGLEYNSQDFKVLKCTQIIVTKKGNFFSANFGLQTHELIFSHFGLLIKCFGTFFEVILCSLVTSNVQPN